MLRAVIRSQTPDPRMSPAIVRGVACRRTAARRRGLAVATSTCTSGHRCLEVLIDGVEEADGRKPRLVGTDQQRQVLGHLAFLDGGDGDLFERVGKLGEVEIVVELGAMAEAACPGEDGGGGVGRGLLALLML